jgi:uncharacterized SAM-binding protein YcdF (DUF218 family)
MFASLIFVLLLFGVLLIACSLKKSGLSVLFLGLISLWLDGSGLVASILLSNLQNQYYKTTSPQWGDKNVIIILGSGTVRPPDFSQSIVPSVIGLTRVFQGAAFYFDCIKHHHQCTLLISGGDALHMGRSEAAVYKQALLSFPINASDILIESQSMNTYQNAKFTTQIVKSKHFDRVYLVTSAFHMKRAMLYFSHFKQHVYPIPAGYLETDFSFSSMLQGFKFAFTDIALHEYAGIFRIRLYEYLGWKIGSATVGKP